MNVTLYEIFCYSVAVILSCRTLHCLFRFYQSRKRKYLFYFAFLQATYVFYLLSFTKTINVSFPQEALFWERLENACIPIFGSGLILFVNSYRRIFSKDFVYLYVLLNVLLSGMILADPNSYQIGTAHRRDFPTLGIVIHETDQPLLIQYFYLSGILMIVWTLFQVISKFFRNPFRHQLLLAGLIVFCVNVFLDLLSAMDVVPFPYTSPFGFLILSFCVDSFLNVNQSEREIRDELKRVLQTPGKFATLKKGGLTGKDSIVFETAYRENSIGNLVQERLLIRTLGDLEFERGGIRIPRSEITHKKKLLQLVKLLLIRFEDGIPIEELTESLCSGMADGNAFNSLHALCFRLGKILGTPDVLSFRENRLFFRRDLVLTDFQRFEKHFETGVHAIHNGDVERAIFEFRVARSFYRGDFFEFDPYFPESEMRREYLRKNLIEIFAFLCEQDEDRKEEGILLEDSGDWIRLDDWDERAWRFHFEALSRLDRRKEALRKFEEFQKNLGREFGVEPEAETLRLIDRIRSDISTRT
ncbi:transcriptional regulator [Leptospira gomenensis]|uniref:Transcriptional regulator n=1 Tax=Leptospira gomenensis TaxID=2484974 RepID=A0A5F1YDY2_9LEPT|nr:BTAD domain-containing putative transcriptional regulator [Leptospira gomenensis]TGK33222.1 transcriptional regulator [Leptospira gomenensis]TGK35546.1 transcriptional regulator [Leptospira gomenensis]TGK40869.1 transcriptional regulator [Leptospira gomenensis]TGK61160.1 transcriptional regulator [Leptospira gomenensis]